MPSPTQRYFEDHAESWDARMPTQYGDLLREFMRPHAEQLAIARTILEVGTGTGALISVLCEIAPQADVIALDLAHAMLAQASTRCPTPYFVQADAHDLPLVSNCCDLIICHNSFPHFADKERALRELLRVAIPQGRMMILHNNPRAVVNAMHMRAGYPIDRDLLPPGDILKAMLADAGFVDILVDDSEQHYKATGRKR